jgi:ATP-binding cassette subfamily B protein
MGNIRRILAQLNKRRKIQLGGLAASMLVASFAEIFSLGAVIPFLSALVAPEKIFQHPQVQGLIQLLNIQNERELIIFATILFGSAALIAGAIRIALNYAQLRLSYTIGADFGSRIFEKTLYQPYLVHVSKHTGTITSGVQKGSQLISNAISPMLSIASSSLMIVFILFNLIYVNPIAAFSAFTGFVIIYIFLFRFSKGRLAINSIIIALNANEYNKILQEGIGGIRDILMEGNQKVYSNQFRKSFSAYQIGVASNQIIGLITLFGIEALGMVLIALLALWMGVKNEGILGAIPVLGALALGAQRMLPLIQMIYSGVVTMKGGKQSVEDALELLQQPMPAITQPTPISFQNSLNFKM